MKKFGIILGFLILFSAIAHAQTDLPLAGWTALESKEQFLDCSKMDEAQLLQPWGELVTVDANLEKMNYFFAPEHLPSKTLRYFCLNYQTAKKPDTKHEIVKSSKALSIKSFIHVRDYEKDEIDGGFWKNWSSGDFDVVHVLTIPESIIKKYDKENPPVINQNGKLSLTAEFKINRALEDLKNGKKSFYDKESYEKWRKNILYFFKLMTDETTHKVVKGPFDSGKSAPDTEEEWGSLEKAGSQFMCYQNGGCAIYNLENLNDTDQYVYVLFFAGDGTSNIHGWKYKNLGELDDFMGLVKVPTKALHTVDSSYAYYQYDPSIKNPTLDFAVEFEVVDTL